MSNELGKSNEALNRARRAKREERKRKFLEILADCGDLRAAAQGAGVSLRSVLRWRKEDSSFAASLGDAEEVAVLKAKIQSDRQSLTIEPNFRPSEIKASAPETTRHA